ncbi:DUF4259 domain-containing protein [Hymenobacter taeanensis]|uniref:DUF4259 domain-containing protein n=1 Tax=Hymenobacter taeanensis TaxID=2735321 RepID=A0A6M6BKY4_9BACT|nr:MULTISPECIES: DUF4259 domain-containing protein [Hymenobacter]QJX48652.1 DUF4259 domain-containing protein [Hymenobacter taeanensis]UOQ81849.1 DUF4259 domain-containing protein [Hymenobacter sp. 5414T-23]
MGTFGYQNFDNDDAADFLADFADDPSELLLLETLITAAEEEGYIEADVAAQALAAAEIVAAWQGQPAADFPEDLQEVAYELDVSDEDELTELARRAVATVLQRSELLELWQESKEFPQWQQAQQDLLKRLE